MSAFWQLYQEKKISQITVREVIELADCNRSTFYAYFADMYDLLDKFEEQLLPDLTQPAVKKLSLRMTFLCRCSTAWPYIKNIRIIIRSF